MKTFFKAVKKIIPIVSVILVGSVLTGSVGALREARIPTLLAEGSAASLQDIKQNVPFTSQAPLGDWSDPVFQNGCEEASIVMAIWWAQNRPLTKNEAQQEIREIAAYEMRVFGHMIDTSAEDTAQIIREHYGYQGIEVAKNIKLEEIRNQIAAGNVIIIPANGRILANPHYTSPGPQAHMVVITGYDPEAKEFIVHDPGTQFGEDFRYPEDRLMSAVWDYPTTEHHAQFPGNEKAEKTMIVVKQAEI